MPKTHAAAPVCLTGLFISAFAVLAGGVAVIALIHGLVIDPWIWLLMAATASDAILKKRKRKGPARKRGGVKEESRPGPSA